MGPDGGAGGGEIVAEGTPEDVCKVKRSLTAKYLKEVLAKDKKIKKEIYHILDVFLRDNVKARKLTTEGYYVKIDDDAPRLDAQAYFMEEYIKKDGKKSKKSKKSKK